MGIEPIILASQTNVLPLYHNYLLKGSGGNRTHTMLDLGLANRYSTIEWHPQNLKFLLTK